LTLDPHQALALGVFDKSAVGRHNAVAWLLKAIRYSLPWGTAL
jgi:hypothetical protein